MQQSRGWTKHVATLASLGAPCRREVLIPLSRFALRDKLLIRSQRHLRITFSQHNTAGGGRSARNGRGYTRRRPLPPIVIRMGRELTLLALAEPRHKTASSPTRVVTSHAVTRRRLTALRSSSGVRPGARAPSVSRYSAVSATRGSSPATAQHCGQGSRCNRRTCPKTINATEQRRWSRWRALKVCAHPLQ